MIFYKKNQRFFWLELKTSIRAKVWMKTIIMQSIKSKSEKKTLSFTCSGLNTGKMVSNHSVGCACFSLCGLTISAKYYQIIGMENMCILRHHESHTVRPRVILAVEKFYIVNCDNFEKEKKKNFFCFGKCVSYMRYRKHLIHKTMWFLSWRSPSLFAWLWLSILDSKSQVELTERLKNNNLSI